jgi:hypothetical protein
MTRCDDDTMADVMRARRWAVAVIGSLVAALGVTLPYDSPADPEAPPPFALRVLTREAVPAPAEDEKPCVAGSPTGAWRFVLTPGSGAEGQDWTTIELEDAASEERFGAIRVYRLSGPCWAPDGTYFVFGEGGVVKGTSPDRSPAVLWQDQAAPRGGIYPAKSYNFRWGTAMKTLSFITVDDPSKEKPAARRVTLRVK